MRTKAKGICRTYSAIVNSTTKRNYRPDLRREAVARASAIRKSQKPVKADKPTKTRGAKAQAAASA
jgi:large subunit ribosomal protein L28e